MFAGFLFLLPSVLGLCPMFGGPAQRLPKMHPSVPGYELPRDYEQAVEAVDFHDVQNDLKKLFVDSQSWWPADYGHYGPFFIRLAWHCSGSYRQSDGRGGCEGGRQRFDPERSWDDNTNLDKARSLLWPIKDKYGMGLSWGDLFILAGTTAIGDMGGPVLGFCGGRMDDPDGRASELLGPTQEQEEYTPCKVNGQCEPPFGSTTIGLIYLNPEGPMGVPLPAMSAPEVRDTFARMGMNDNETVALIGGGHAFGKTHGACPDGPGPSPKEDPMNPWPGNCGSGKGMDAFTSGFEGPWTPNPTTWDNQYFKQLIARNWSVHLGAGGHHQWKTTPSPVAPGPQGGKQDVMMLTSDISLLHDPSFLKLVTQWAEDIDSFNDAFAHAWYKLTTRDMGPVTRCVGKDIPPAQGWQYPLPKRVSPLADFDRVARDLRAMMTTNDPAFPADIYNGKANYGPLLVRLAWRCAATFRTTDYLGGCNGARIRFSPAKEWPINKALDSTLMLLQPIKDRHGDGLSWADLIGLAGTVALEEAGALKMPFCGGRTDAADGAGWDHLEPRLNGSTTDTLFDLMESMRLLGMTAREMIALHGGGHSLGQMHQNRSGYQGSWTTQPTRLSNEYFHNLAYEHYEAYTQPDSGLTQYRSSNGLNALHTDLLYKWDPALMAVVQEYASDNDVFLHEFGHAWSKLMNADRFSGPAGNVCH